MAGAGGPPGYDAQAAEVYALMHSFGIDKAHALTNGTYNAVKAWADLCGSERWYSSCFLVPMEFEGANGIMLMESTAASTAKYKENYAAFQAGTTITDPHWMYYTLMWFPGLTLLNFGGLAHGRIEGRALQMRVGELFDVLFNGTTWRQEYAWIREGYFLASLRRLIRERLNAYNWLELTIGRSYIAYAALDVYVKVVSYQMPLPDEEAHFVLNASLPWWQRTWFPRPDEWWYFQDWYSYGQRPSPAEWKIEYGLQDVPEDELANRMRSLPVGMTPGIGGSIIPDHVRQMYHEEQQKMHASMVARAKAAAKYTPGLANPAHRIMDGRVAAADGILQAKGKGKQRSSL